MLQKYLESLHDIFTNPKANEVSHRPQLNSFLMDIKTRLESSNNDFATLKVYHENTIKTKHRKIMPDFLVVDSELIKGMIENKKAATFECVKEIDDLLKDNKGQVEKYMQLRPNLILTDYLSFYLLGYEDTQNLDSIKSPRRSCFRSLCVNF